MGLFSFDCLGCGHPMLSLLAANAVNKWMNLVVAILPDGRVIDGSYDGYGRVGDHKTNLAAVGTWDDVGEHHNGPACYHRACWLDAGRPKTWKKQSQRSDDQGWFFLKGAHDMPEPNIVFQNN